MHLSTEESHLALMTRLVPREHHTRLLPLWRIAGFSLGYLPVLVLGSQGLFRTIQYVETFVEVHYNEQIEWLELQGEEWRPLVEVLESCCADEVEHKEDSKRRVQGVDRVGWMIWKMIVEKGSKWAVQASRWL